MLSCSIPSPDSLYFIMEGRWRDPSSSGEEEGPGKLNSSWKRLGFLPDPLPSDWAASIPLLRFASHASGPSVRPHIPSFDHQHRFRPRAGAIILGLVDSRCD